MEQAIFAAGCFWSPEADFARLPGVTATEVGYTGGTKDNPTYEQVCTGRTGHAEAVRVEFDPAKISYADLVEKFFAMHDPTQLNRQGPDTGTQYRTAIFTATPEQEKTAQEIKAKLDASGRFKKPIATVIEPAKKFWRAEEYHQKYYDRRGGGSCRI